MSKCVVGLLLILALFDLNFDGVGSNDEINKKPETLGNNEVPMITKTIEEDMKIETNDEGFVNLSNDENCVRNEKDCEETTNNDTTESKNIEVDKYGGTLNLRDDSIVAHECGKSPLMFGSKKNTCEMKSRIEVDHDKNVISSEDKKITRQKQKSNNIRNEAPSLDSYEGGDGNWGQAYASPGFRNTFSLDVTVEDIENGILMTEKILEEYNMNRLAMKNKKSK